MAESTGRAPGRRGLGRGLSALLGEGPQPASQMDPSGGDEGDYQTVPVARVHPNPDQPRRHIDEAALAALSASIAAHGLMQPVVVRRHGEEFEIIAGERRWRAAQKVGIDQIPVVIRDADDRVRLELALVENMVREDLSPIEVANAIAVLAEDFGQSHGRIAAHLGRSRPAVSNLLRLLELPDEVQEMVDRGDLSEGHARAILMADGARARRRLAEDALSSGWSVRELERRARASSTGSRKVSRETSVPDALADEALDLFTGVCDAPVRVSSRASGEIVVEVRFPSPDALKAAMGRIQSGS